VAVRSRAVVAFVASGIGDVLLDTDPTTTILVLSCYYTPQNVDMTNVQLIYLDSEFGAVTVAVAPSVPVNTTYQFPPFVMNPSSEVQSANTEAGDNWYMSGLVIT